MGDAESVAHDVWTAFLVWLPDHQDHPNLVGVLYTIARRRAVDQYRIGRSAHLGLDILESLKARVVVTSGGTDLRIDLEQALLSLTPRERYALYLHYLLRFSVDDTARQLDTGRDNTKKIIKRALKSLREHPSLSGYQAHGEDAREVQT